MSILFNEIVFGPIKSRRLGISLGINLLPSDYKFCSFDCIYCECGWGMKKEGEGSPLPSRAEVYTALELRLQELKKEMLVPDAITFAGNGEPTLHPEFPGIIDDVISLRDAYLPDTKIGVLSNASMLHKPEILESLQKIELNMLKLDAGTDETFRAINKPPSRLTLDILLNQFKELKGNLIIQSIFFRGVHEGKKVDNTSDAEVEAWIRCLKEVDPQYAMVYTIDRDTPEEDLEKLSFDELLSIGRRAEAQGIPTQVYG